MLGHKMPKIMATYNKNEMLPQRKDALEKWANFVGKLVLESHNSDYTAVTKMDVINEY